VLECNTWLKTPVSNESWINMMLSYCLVGLASYCSNASGTKWYVDDSPHLEKNIFLTSYQINHLFWVERKTRKFHLFLWFDIFSKKLVQIYFSKTGKIGENGQSFTGIAKSLWDQTIGSERAALAMKTSGSLSTGSPIGSLELTSLIRLNVQSGHCNDP
jgi:hypothetical protein